MTLTLNDLACIAAIVAAIAAGLRFVIEQIVRNQVSQLEGMYVREDIQAEKNENIERRLDDQDEKLDSLLTDMKGVRAALLQLQQRRHI